VANGLPQAAVDQFTSGSGPQLSLTGTGDLGARILASVPEAFQAAVAPMIPAIVKAIHEAFAFSIASTFWVAIGAALLAAVAVLFLREQTVEEMVASARERAPKVGEEPDGPTT
jgi:hypothetical protein